MAEQAVIEEWGAKVAIGLHNKNAGLLEELRNRLGKDVLSMDEWNALVDAASFLRIEAMRRRATLTKGDTDHDDR